MIISWPGLTRLRVQVLAIRTLRHAIVVPEKTSASQLGDQKINDILEGARLDRVCLVKSVQDLDISLRRDLPN